MEVCVSAGRYSGVASWTFGMGNRTRILGESNRRPDALSAVDAALPLPETRPEYAYSRSLMQ